MQLFERWEDILAAIKTGMESLQNRIWTLLPVKVTAVDLSNQTVTLQSQVKGRQLMPVNGQLTWQDVSLPPFAMVPIKFHGGGNWWFTFPVAAGDEGTVHFASRCIDNWWGMSGEQPMVTQGSIGSLRQHHLSDGFFISGGRSKPNALANVSTTAPQIRSTDGKSYLEVGPDGFKVVYPGGSMTLDTSGNLSVTGAITAQAEITAHAGRSASITVSQHTHNAVMTGLDHTNKPDPGT